LRLEREGWKALSTSGEAAERFYGGEPYSALFNSTYVREDGVWRLAIHQQTPI
jgi:hypothetical protein